MVLKCMIAQTTLPLTFLSFFVHSFIYLSIIFKGYFTDRPFALHEAPRSNYPEGDGEDGEKIDRLLIQYRLHHEGKVYLRKDSLISPLEHLHVRSLSEIVEARKGKIRDIYFGLELRQ